MRGGMASASTVKNGPWGLIEFMARRKPPKKSTILRLNKIDVAEAHIVAAVKLFFEDGHPASILHTGERSARNSDDARRQAGHRNALASNGEMEGRNAQRANR